VTLLRTESVLQSAGFDDIAEYHFPTPYVWTVDTLLGYLHSTAVASPSVLGWSNSRPT
jgi:hypothetical protein